VGDWGGDSTEVSNLYYVERFESLCWVCIRYSTRHSIRCGRIVPAWISQVFESVCSARKLSAVINFSGDSAQKPTDSGDICFSPLSKAAYIVLLFEGEPCIEHACQLRHGFCQLYRSWAESNCATPLSQPLHCLLLLLSRKKDRTKAWRSDCQGQQM
jgi:hypothetical protein